MPQRREESWVDARCLLGVGGMLAGLWFVYEKNLLGVVLCFSVGSAMFTGILESTRRCYYCLKSLYNFQRTITVTWSEPLKYSNKIIVLSEQMHYSCHQRARHKFKIPHPGYASFTV